MNYEMSKCQVFMEWDYSLISQNDSVVIFDGF